MSTNCIRCVTAKRTGADLLCDACRAQAKQTPLGTNLACSMCGAVDARWKMWTCQQCGRQICAPCSLATHVGAECLCTVCRGKKIAADLDRAKRR